MRLQLRVILLNILLVLLITRASAQSGTNMGKEFYTTYADHIYPAALPGNALPKSSSMVLYIRADVNSNVTVELLGGTTSTFPVTAGQTYEYQVPPTSFLGNLSNGKLNRAIHISSDNNIAVFAELYGVGGGVGVTSATMLLPVAALGQDYRSLNYTQLSNSTLTTPSEGKSFSFFDVVATADNTIVQIALPAGTTIYNGDPTLNVQTSAPAQLTLNRGDVYQALSDNDLSNAHIRVVSPNGSVCNPVAVFSGSTKIYLGNSATGCALYKTSDNLFQQVAPTASWGNHFITVPLKGRESNLGIYRIQFNDVNTNYTISGNYTPLSSDKSKGYVEFSSAEPLVITADGPIQVAQYAFTQFMVSCPAVFTPGDTGDPDMIYLTPIDQGISSASFYATGRYTITNSYVNVVIPTAAAGSLRLDGLALPSGVTFTPVAGNTDYSYAQLPVTSGLNASGSTLPRGTHTLSASQPFVASAYGFGNYESYGYPVGASFNKMNRSVAVKESATGNDVSVSACSGISYTPQVTLPFMVNQITWQVDGNTINVQQNPTVANIGQQNDQPVYTYKYQNETTNSGAIYIGAAGQHQITAAYPTPCADCQESTNFNITVLNSPIPVFTSVGNCATNPVIFSLTTPSSLTGVNNITWNFGDGSPAVSATTATISHTYTAAGDYQASVTISYANGCTVNSSAVTVHIIAKPVAGFTYASPDCAGSSIQFSDASDAKGHTISWVWDFGDGATSTLQNPVHSYKNAGSYQVTLTVTNINGCTGIPKILNVVVNPVPVINLTYRATICSADQPFQIGVNTNGSVGSGTFSGDGISAAGNFDPAGAGVGTHAINYFFTSGQTGCTFSQTFNIVVKPTPTIVMGPDVRIMYGESVMLNAAVTGDSLSYKWTPGNSLDHDDILNPVATPLDDTKYMLTVTSPFGCTASAYISVTVLKVPKPVNTFTPNGDGINDYWYIDQLEKYPDATVNVYNRAGLKVYNSIGYGVPWDGKFNGSDLPVGVYYYIVTLKNTKKVISGYVTIVR